MSDQSATTNASAVGIVYDDSLSLRDHIRRSLGDYANRFDIDALEEDLRNQINVAICASQGCPQLVGEEIFYYRKEGLDPFDIKVRIDRRVDFWAIAARHDKTD